MIIVGKDGKPRCNECGYEQPDHWSNIPEFGDGLPNVHHPWEPIANHIYDGIIEQILWGLVKARWFILKPFVLEFQQAITEDRETRLLRSLCWALIIFFVIFGLALFVSLTRGHS